MIHIHFDELKRPELFLRQIGAGLTDLRRFWSDFVVPFVHAEADEVFHTEGRGTWADLNPVYAARKAVTHPGKGILERTGAYRNAATHPNAPGSLLQIRPEELVVGVDPSHFEANYPALHEEGNEKTNLSARPVYSLIVGGPQFEERLGRLGEKYFQEVVNAAERRGRAS